jgi:hypothetical protein
MQANSDRFAKGLLIASGFASATRAMLSSRRVYAAADSEKSACVLKC